jgi:prepilin-type N-terminal cleavage/methylation domain-containing protein
MNEDGFTIIELMVTVAITALIGLVVWQGAVHAQGIVEKVTFFSSVTVKTLQIEESLRNRTAKIQIPFWVGSVDISMQPDNGRLEIPFYEGKENMLLTVQHAGTALLIGQRERGSGEILNVQQFESIAHIEYDLILKDDRELRGIQYSLYDLNGRHSPVQILAGFGSNPFWLELR